MKIAFIHSKCKPFRIEFLLKIQEIYDIDFFFYDENRGNIKNFNEIKVIKIPFLSDFNYAINLKKLLLKNDYDVFISTDLGYHITHIAYEIAKKKNKKFILWNEQWMDIKHPRRVLMKSYENRIIKNSDAILSFGKKASDFLINRGANEARIVKVPNAVPKINIEKVLNKEYKYEDIDFDNKINIVCIARLIPVKGHKYLIRAIKRVKEKYPNIQLIIAGEGPEYKKLKSIIRNLSLEKEIIIPGKAIKDIEKWNLYDNADIVILPSVYTRHAEAWGLVVNEAAMLSKAIITTDMTGVADEIIRNNISGCIVKEKDSVDMAKAIISLIDDKDKSIKYGKKAKELVEKEYTIDNMVKGFIKAIEISHK